MLRKPFLAISSNTPKIETLCNEIGLEIKTRIIKEVEKVKFIPKFNNNELDNIDAYLKKAQLNFQFLKKEIKEKILND